MMAEHTMNLLATDLAFMMHLCKVGFLALAKMD